MPTVCSVPTGAARFSARAFLAYEVSVAGRRPANSWGTQAYSGTVRRWFQSPAKASAPLMVLASPRISMISSAQAVFSAVGSGRPAGTSVPQALVSARSAASVSQGLVSRQSAGRRILSCRSAQARVASEMSFLTTVLSQSKAATGRGPWCPEQLPRSSIIFWSLARLWPYHLMLVESWGQVARAGAFAGAAVAGAVAVSAERVAAPASPRARAYLLEPVVPNVSSVVRGGEHAGTGTRWCRSRCGCRTLPSGPAGFAAAGRTPQTGVT